MKHCLSEGDYDDVASDTSHSEANNDNLNKNDTPFDHYAFALKVLENEAAKINQRKHGLMVMLIKKSVIMMVFRRRMSKSSALENGLDDFLEDVSEQMRTAKFIHTHTHTHIYIYTYIHNLYIYMDRDLI